MILPRPLRGIIPPLVTPLLGQNTLDVSGLARLIEHVIAGGVAGVFILGTTGEGANLSGALRRQMIDRTCEYVAGRVPVLVGVTDSCVEESLRLGAHAATRGAAAVVSACTYPFRLSQDEFLSHLERIHAKYPLPVFLYNLPGRVNFSIEPETVARAAELSNVWGLKDSSFRLEYFREVADRLRGRPEFTLLDGPEQILAETVALGGHGGVCGGANLYPALYVELYEAAVAVDEPRICELQRTVRTICDRIYSIGPSDSAYLRGLKCALAVRGICSEVVADPYFQISPQERESIQACLEEIGLSPAGA